MENENLDLEEKPAGNKDLWLFLIIIDIVALCVLGFFLYKHFSADLFAKTVSADSESIVAVVEENQPAQEVANISIADEPKAEPVKENSSLETTLVSEIIAEETPVINTPVPVMKADEKVQAPAEKKLSIEITRTKSKYRRVTFRWYGEGKKVQIVSGFTMSKPQTLKKKKDYWEITLSILPGTYKFLYVIDGENQLDPYSAQKNGRSIVVIE